MCYTHSALSVTVWADWTQTLTDNAHWSSTCRRPNRGKDYPSIVFLTADVDTIKNIVNVCGITSMPTFHV